MTAWEVLNRCQKRPMSELTDLEVVQKAERVYGELQKLTTVSQFNFPSQISSSSSFQMVLTRQFRRNTFPLGKSFRLMNINGDLSLRVRIKRRWSRAISQLGSCILQDILTVFINSWIITKMNSTEHYTSTLDKVHVSKE